MPAEFDNSENGVGAYALPSENGEGAYVIHLDR